MAYLAHHTRLDNGVTFALIETAGLDADGRTCIQSEAALGRLGGRPRPRQFDSDGMHSVTVRAALTDSASRPPVQESCRRPV